MPTPAEPLPRIAAIVVNDGSSHCLAIIDMLLQQRLPLAALGIVNTSPRPVMTPQTTGVQVLTFTAPANAGYAQCVNPVLRQWIGRYDAIWLLDGRPDAYTLQQLWQHSQNAHIVSAGVIFNTGVMTRAYRIDRLIGRLVPIGFADLTGIEVLSRHGTLIPARVFQQVGLLDERLHKFWEMADFCLRAKTAGFGLHVHTKAKVTISQPATAQTPQDLFYMVRNRWWVVQPLQTLWQSAAMMLWDGWIWLGLVTSWAMAVGVKKGNPALLYEKARLYWWGVYQGVHPFPPKVD